MLLSIIAAMDSRGLIGDETGMPWHLPKDLRRFRELTMGKPIIVGRRTFELIGKPLPGRLNIVLTHNADYRPAGCRVARTFREALSIAEDYLASAGGDEVMVIGGSQVYAEAIQRWDRCYTTIVEGQFKGSAYFPVRELLSHRWRPVREAERFPSDEKNRYAHSFHVIERVRDATSGSARLDEDTAQHAESPQEEAPEELDLAAILARGTVGSEAFRPKDAGGGSASAIPELSVNRTATGACPMPVNCELRPHHDATTDQLKTLGLAVKEWVSRELGNEGVLCSIDQDGLLSLLLGEPPNPLGSQVAKNQPDVPLERIRADLGPLASDRSLRFTVKDEPDCTRAKVIESLRRAIPAELVKDILIDDVSWASEEPMN